MNKKLAKAACAHCLSAYAYPQPRDAERYESKEKIQFQVEESNRVFIISFPGSVEVSDWKFNLRYAQHGRGMHEGFLAAYRTVEDALIWHTADKDVILVGHSLGGALAQLAAFHLVEKCNIENVVLFGSPRVFSPELCKRYNSQLGFRTYNIWYKSDLVTHIPFRWMPSWADGWVFYEPVNQIVQLNGGWWHELFRSILKPGIQPRHALELYHAALSH